MPTSGATTKKAAPVPRLSNSGDRPNSTGWGASGGMLRRVAGNMASMASPGVMQGGRTMATTPSIPSSRSPANPLPVVSNKRSTSKAGAGVQSTALSRLSTSSKAAGVSSYRDHAVPDTSPAGHLYTGSDVTRAMERGPPQLPSQRRALQAEGEGRAKSRVAGMTLGGPARSLAIPSSGRGTGAQYTSGVPVLANLDNRVEYSRDAIAGGYTYMPINPDYPGLRRIHKDPPIYVIEQFLTDSECSALIQTAGPLLQRSKTHAAAGSEATKGRTSLTCHLPKSVYPCPILLDKIHALTGKPRGHMELPQVARYASSQRYVEHYDGVDPHTEAGRSFCASGGQRVATVLMYLNEVPDGGSTRFKRLDIEVKPIRGNALVFFPGFENGELDTDVLHSGQPAVDTKWVSQVWIRKSFREDGQPSAPVPIEEQSLVGPLHEGIYRGLCIAGNDVHEAVMTWDEAKAYADSHPEVMGFTWAHRDRYPKEPTRFWFKRVMEVLYNEDWWSYSTGRGM